MPVFLALHVVMSVSLAFIFTPIFTVGLGSLPANLYEHGSALLGTVQQVAAAAGTALVITVMASRTASLTASGAAPHAATAGGIGVGIGVAAALAGLSIVLSFFLAKGRASTHGPVAGH